MYFSLRRKLFGAPYALKNNNMLKFNTFLTKILILDLRMSLVGAHQHLKLDSGGKLLGMTTRILRVTLMDDRFFTFRTIFMISKRNLAFVTNFLKLLNHKTK